MEDNPYQKLVKSFDGRSAGMQRTPFRLGEVKALAPLTIEVDGTDQSGNLWVNARMAYGKEKLLNAEGWLSLVPGGTVTVLDGELEVKAYELKTGDQVLLLSLDDQQFYVICRVVKA